MMMPGGLEDGLQEVWSRLVVWIMYVRWISGCMSLSGGNQRAIWRSGIYPGINTQQIGIYPGIHIGLESWKFKFPGLIE